MFITAALHPYVTYLLTLRYSRAECKKIARRNNEHNKNMVVHELSLGFMRVFYAYVDMFYF
jgi:hypothetical protein